MWLAAPGTSRAADPDPYGILLKNNVSKPTTFCWPIYAVHPGLFESMASNGYIFARGGHELAYRPLVDTPFDAPSFTFHDQILKNENRFVDMAKNATNGSISIFTFHGVPDLEHPGSAWNLPILRS
ncbi:MAG: hypothetical protein K9N23_22560 [Akkermansiaceae bacterium]|nr:hypothetical protein [Akkermansiaceae bacterium]MCF7734483.1 hypothetical protein [Akkermansiaceae bacterium]